MKIAIGSDHSGYQLKERLKKYLQELNIEYKDFGCKNENSVDYPDIGFEVSNEIRKGNFERGILICGTGIGMSIVANKIKGIRASLCNDVFSAQKAREHTNANILALGGSVIGIGLAQEIVKVWLKTNYSQEERHVRRLNKIKKIEK